MRNYDKLSHVFSGFFGGILLFVLAYITILAPFSVIPFLGGAQSYPDC